MDRAAARRARRSSSIPAARSERGRIRRPAPPSSCSRGSSAAACSTPAAAPASCPWRPRGSDSRRCWRSTRTRSRSRSRPRPRDETRSPSRSLEPTFFSTTFPRRTLSSPTSSSAWSNSSWSARPRASPSPPGYLASQTPHVPRWEHASRLALDGWAADILPPSDTCHKALLGFGRTALKLGASMATFSVRFLGCKVSYADAQAVRERLLGDGHDEVDRRLRTSPSSTPAASRTRPSRSRARPCRALRERTGACT